MFSQFFSLNFVSITPNHFFENNKNCIHLFYYSSSIYRYILVKRNMVEHLLCFETFYWKIPNLGTFIQL
uniref:Uncharacterized protein n=1 Tax=Amphiprion ocellaris TaxID=80972 RepID=A0AAQ5X5G2_AMPOC